MKSRINIKQGTLDQMTLINARRLELEASVLIDAGSPINAGSLLNAGVSRSVF